MVNLDYKSGKSLHEQISDGIKTLIITKAMPEHQQLPSVRELSITLTVNPNTVQKAYKVLESEGFIYSIKGKGNFVSSINDAKNEKKLLELYNSLESTIKELLYLGESKEKIFNRIKEEAL